MKKQINIPIIPVIILLVIIVITVIIIVNNNSSKKDNNRELEIVNNTKIEYTLKKIENSDNAYNLFVSIEGDEPIQIEFDKTTGMNDNILYVKEEPIKNQTGRYDLIVYQDSVIENNNVITSKYKYRSEDGVNYFFKEYIFE